MDIEKKFITTYSTHSDQIFRFIFFKLNDREKAVDLAQETFMKTWIYISKNGSIENVRAFLYRVANNLVVDEYRKRGRVNVKSLDEMMEDGFEPMGSVEEPTVHDMGDIKASSLIKELPEVYSEILFMRYVEDLHVSEIAEITGKSTNVISVRINRGLKKLRELIEKRK